MPPLPYYISHIDLHIDITDENLTKVSSTLIVTMASEPASLDLVLDGNQDILQLHSIKLNGKSLQPDSDYRITSQALIISQKTFKEIKSSFSLDIILAINPANYQANSGLCVEDEILYSHCEPTGFRNITYFIDDPRVCAIFTTTLRAKKSRFPTLLSNGHIKNFENFTDGTHEITWKHVEPKSSYLFAIVAGNLAKITDTFKYANGHEVAIEIYTKEKDLRKCQYALECQKKVMDWAQKTLGLIYELSNYKIVAVNDLIVWGMENPSLIIVNSAAIFATPEETTDERFDQINMVISHEFFHYWFGHLVPLESWREFGLKEGLAHYFSLEYTKDNSLINPVYSRANLLRARVFDTETQSNTHPIHPPHEDFNIFLSPIMYDKSATVISMLRILLGNELFQNNFKIFIGGCTGKPTTLDNFINIMFENTGTLEKYKNQFKLWHTQTGIPTLKAEWKYDYENKEFVIRLSQSSPTENPLYIIPVRVLVYTAQGNIATDAVFILNEKCQEFSCKASATATLGFLPDFETLVRTDFQTTPNSVQPPHSSPLLAYHSSQQQSHFRQYTPEDLIFLMKNASHVFIRWDACQMLRRWLVEKLSFKTSSFELDQDDDYNLFITTLEKILLDSNEDAVLKANFIFNSSLPRLFQNDSWHMNNNAVHYNTIKRSFFQRLSAVSKRIVSQLQIDNPSAYGERVLFVECIRIMYSAYNQQTSSSPSSFLSHITSFSASKPELHLINIVQSSNNMTNISNALELLTSLGNEETADAALTTFFSRYKNQDAIVLYGMETISNLEITHALKWLTKLEEENIFNIHKTNHVHSLWYCFFLTHIAELHQHDNGYEKLCLSILKLAQIRSERLAHKIVSSIAKCDLKEDCELYAELVKLLDTLKPLRLPKLSAQIEEYITRFRPPQANTML